MTDHTDPRPRPPWLMGFPFLPPPHAPDGGREPLRSSWLMALRCRLRRNAIDRELAGGADPESSDCRHLRAAQLTAQSNREALAARYERLLIAATSMPPLDMLPVNWQGMRTARPRLDRLAQRLRETGPVSAQGVARARLLLTGQDSALYDRISASHLRDEVRSTLALL